MPPLSPTRPGSRQAPNPCKRLKRAQMRGAARRSGARRTLCTSSAPTEGGALPQMGPFQPPALDLYRHELGRVVLIERQALLEHVQLQQGVLHDLHRLEIHAAVDRQEWLDQVVGTAGGGLGPADALGRDADGLLGVLAEE